MKRHLTLIFALLSICTGIGAAMAQTPDGLPPALETVCDMETGAAYGLCNAYCEAMDCETDNPLASATACSRVGDKFQQLTGRDLPCKLSCPCADSAVSPLFAEVLAGSVVVVVCFTEPVESITDGIVIPFNDETFVFSVLFTGQWACGDESVFLPISPAQGQVCAQLLEQAANAQGVACVPPPAG